MRGSGGSATGFQRHGQSGSPGDIRGHWDTGVCGLAGRSSRERCHRSCCTGKFGADSAPGPGAAGAAGAGPTRSRGSPRSRCPCGMRVPGVAAGAELGWSRGDTSDVTQRAKMQKEELSEEENLICPQVCAGETPRKAGGGNGSGRERGTRGKEKRGERGSEGEGRQQGKRIGSGKPVGKGK